MTELCSTVWIYHILLIYSLAGCLGFHFLAIIVMVIVIIIVMVIIIIML